MDEVIYCKSTRDRFIHEHLFFRDAKLKEYWEPLGDFVDSFPLVEQVRAEKAHVRRNSQLRRRF